MSARILITQGRIKSPLTVMTAHGVSPQRIALPVANIFGVDPAQIKARDNHWPVVDARTACAELVYELAHPRKIHLGLMMWRKKSSGWEFLERNSRRTETDPLYRAKLNAARAALGI